MATSPRLAILIETDRAAELAAAEAALREAGIPFTSGVRSHPEPGAVIAVPEDRLDEARSVVEGRWRPASDDSEDDEPGALPAPRAFPWRALRSVSVLLAAHLAIVLAWVGRDPTPSRLARAGGLVTGAGPGQAWRLVSYLLVHSEPAHVLWNGLSLLVFAVPILDEAGMGRALAIYLASGIAGGVAALVTSAPGTVTVGSSGAVAGLFGAWLTRSLLRSRGVRRERREWLRITGLGLLVLPSLLAPTSATGHRISIAAHLGGLAAGALLAALGLAGPTRSIRVPPTDEGRS